jgi:undecaprenyl diphosphate synthase
LLARKAAAGEIDPEHIDEAMFAASLYAPDVPEPDLLIRTSGEQRISNYLLWQMAYTEMVFVNEHWPDFDAIDLSVVRSMNMPDASAGLAALLLQQPLADVSGRG